MPFEAPVVNPDDPNPIVAPTESTVTKKKKGFNPDQLRKTIVTKIDKDGFNERTVYYGKDSGGSGDWSTAHVTFICQNEDPSNSNGYIVYIPVFNPDYPDMICVGALGVYPNDDPPIEVEVPLYKGSLILLCYPGLEHPCILNVDFGITPVVSGEVSLQPSLYGADEPGWDIVITGDGTFTAQALGGSDD